MKVNNATVSVKLQYIGTQIAGTYEITFPLEHAGENELEIRVRKKLFFWGFYFYFKKKNYIL